MALQKVARRSASAAVFDQLLTEVLTGDLTPGEALPAERSLTEVLEVNRQAVREALQRLAQAGLVEINHGGSTRVLDFTRTAGLDLLPHLLVRGGSFDPEVVSSVMEMRARLGPHIARLAAERGDGDLATRLDELVEVIREGSEAVPRARADLAFWDLLVDGSDNIAYRLAFNGLRAVYEPILDLVAPFLAGEIGDVASHEQIVDAVRAHDADVAERAAQQLLDRGTAALAQMLAAVEQGGIK
jgi:GntR family transcriptional regulator, transcriptional repressor for pyruvate dehydrogenase complex